ncbi:MAG: choice-of-anchor D domain-containing protein [Janthinobacterium lividum]
MKQTYSLFLRLVSALLLTLVLRPAAQAQCNFSVTVSPGGPLTVPSAGGSHTLTAGISTAGYNFSGTGFDAAVEAILVQADGKILVGGRFKNYNGVDCPDYLARLNADGSIDQAFNPVGAGQTAWGFDASVSALLQQPDGKLLVGGSFLAYNGAASCPDKLVRLNADGSIDAAFNAGGTGYGRFDTYPSSVLSLALAANGQILVGGTYLLYNGLDCSQSLTRLNPDGAIDAAFIPRPTVTNAQWGISGGTVNALLVQPDGKIVFGGSIGSYNGNPSCPDGVARLNSNGTLDATFNAGGMGFSGGTYGSFYGSEVKTLALQPNGSMLVGGAFNTFNQVACPSGVARVLPTGLLDTSFNPGGAGIGGSTLNYILNSLALQPDGKVLVGGVFTSYNAQAVPYHLMRLTATGAVDPSFNGTGAGVGDAPYMASSVRVVALQNGNQALVGGLLLRYNGVAGPPYFMRTLPDGTLDNQPSPLTTPATYLWSPGGQTTPSIAVTQAGSYSVAVTANGCTTRSNTVVVTPPSTCAISVVIDPPGPLTLPGNGGQLLKPTVVTQAFNVGGSGFDAEVKTLLALPDGRRLAGGNFSTYNGQPCPARLVRLLANGTLDPSFNPGGAGFNNSVATLLLQPDGKILVGGSFTSYNGSAAANDGVVRLLADGTLDPAFNAGGSGFGTGSTGSPAGVSVLVLQNGKIVVGGGFARYNGFVCPNNLMRLNADGSYDNSFNSFSGSLGGFNAGVTGVVALPSGQLLAVGGFAAYNSVATGYGIARLSADGALDATFTRRSFNSTVYTILLEPSGTVLVGGGFSSYNGLDCPDALVRLDTNGVLQAFNSGAGFRTSNFAGYVMSLAVQPDGKVLVGGGFDNYNSQPVGGVVRLSASGVLDVAFNGGRGAFGNVVQAIVVEVDGQLLVGGSFTGYFDYNTLKSYGAGYLGRVFPDGALNDHVILTENISYSWSLGGQTTPGIYVTQPGTYSVTATRGGCSATSNVVVVSGTGSLPAAASCGHVVQVSPAGPVSLPAGGSQVLTAAASSPGFNAGGKGFDGPVLVTLVQADGRIVVGGGFTSYNGQDCPDFLVRLLPDGTLDPTFNPGGYGFRYFGVDAAVFALVQQPDGKLLVGGGFGSYDGLNCPDNLVRLNADGSLDTSYNAGGSGFGGRVNALALRPTGQLVVGGSMYSFNGATCPQGIMQVTATGQRDASFSTGTGVTGRSSVCSGGVGSVVYALALQADGRVVLGGEFSTFNGNAACPDHLARLTTTGALDATFNPGGTGTDCFVQVLLIQPDGKLLAGGAISAYNGQFIAEGLIRLTTTGTVDPAFDLGGRGFVGGVGALVLQPGGKIVVGGSFPAFNNQNNLSRYLLRVSDTGAFDPNFNAGGAGFNLGGYVQDLTQLPDGRLLVGGNFTTYNGQSGPASLVRLSADGSPNLTPTALATGVSYTWSPGNQTTPTLTVTQPGTYAVTTTLNGCVATSNAVLVLSGNPPTLTTISPGSGVVGTVVTVTGTNLTGATTLLLNGQAIPSFVVNAAGTSLTFTVPAGATTGLVAVTTPSGTATSATPFVVTTPQLALAVGATAYASGSTYNFGPQAIGSSSAAISFSLTNAGTAPLTLTTVRATNDFGLSGAVPATVPAGGAATVLVSFTPSAVGTRTGVLEVVSSLGTYQVMLTGTGTYPVPTATSFSPLSGPPGTVVTITGTNFLAGSTSVSFNGVLAQVVTVGAGGTTLTCTVPAGATAGPLVVTTTGGTATPTGFFCVHYLATTAGVSRCGVGSVALVGAGLSTAGSYVWYDQATGGQPLAATGSGNSVFNTPSLSQGTMYYVAISTGTGATACEGPRQPVAVAIETGPMASIAATGSLSLCQGGTLVLTASGAAAYRWSTGATTASITVQAAGQYAVVGSSATGCAGSSVAITVSASPTPPRPTITAAPGSTGTVLTSSSATGNQWYLNNVLIAGATGPTYTVANATQQGSYTVVVTSAAGCVSLPSASQAVVLAATAPTPAAGLQVYPNPAHLSAEVRLPAALLISRVELVNALGQVVYQRTLAATTQQFSLDLTGLATGVYALRVYYKAAVLSARLIIN